jgi:cytochrome c oxidase cbb3-type subunit 3
VFGASYALPAVLLLLLLSACEKEARVIASDQPQTSPRSVHDPRVSGYEINAYQVSQGGRYFTWYGCGRCHARGSSRDLTTAGARRGLPSLYTAIAQRHTSGARIPPEQIWQIAGYLRSLPHIDAARRDRQDRDLRAEPQGSTWTGAIR